VIGAGWKPLLGLAPGLQGGVHERRLQPEPARELGGDADVLRHERETEP
jgi:hypothetical protein